jgi:hypothetical protein
MSAPVASPALGSAGPELLIDFEPDGAGPVAGVGVGAGAVVWVGPAVAAAGGGAVVVAEPGVSVGGGLEVVDEDSVGGAWVEDAAGPEETGPEGESEIVAAGAGLLTVAVPCVVEDPAVVSDELWPVPAAAWSGDVDVVEPASGVEASAEVCVEAGAGGPAGAAAVGAGADTAVEAGAGSGVEAGAGVEGGGVGALADDESLPAAAGAGGEVAVAAAGVAALAAVGAAGEVGAGGAAGAAGALLGWVLPADVPGAPAR